MQLSLNLLFWTKSSVTVLEIVNMVINAVEHPAIRKLELLRLPYCLYLHYGYLWVTMTVVKHVIKNVQFQLKFN